MASKGKDPVKKAPKKKNGYEMPKPLKPGDIIADNQKVQWKIGVSIGVGGFGEIYSACKHDSKIKKIDDYPFVVKIEPKENGPLFVEMHFYMRSAKQEDIEKFKKDHKLKALGMPEFIAMGSHEIQQIKHRFIVLPRFGRDIWKIFNEHDHKFPLHTVYRLGWQILNVLEYIHGCTYVHGDIKGSNILLGFGKGGDEQVYLLDFGLACHYNTKDFKPDPKKMHNGTIEYTPRDAHQGVPTRRGDIEILAYNLIEYAGAKLPWVVKTLLNKPVEVQKLKEEFMKSTDKSLKTCFANTPVPKPLSNLLKYVESMKHDTVPDYTKIRGLFESGIKDLGQKNSGVLQFAGTKAATPKKTSLGRPDFSKTLNTQKKKDEDAQPGPSKAPAPAKRARGAKKYVEVESDDSGEEMEEKQKTTRKSPKRKATQKQSKADDGGDEVEEKQKTTRKSPMKKPAQKQSKAEEVPIESRTVKRSRERKQYAAISDSDGEVDEVKETPKKKSKVASPESGISPKNKKAEKKKKESAKDQELKDDTEKSTVTLKGKTNSSKNKKTYHLNFNLDVSLNSDVVVHLNRKDKKKKKKDDVKSANDEVGDEVENEPGQNNRAGVYKGKSAKAK